MNAPNNITAGRIVAGRDTTISWSGVSDVDGYEIFRSVNGGSYAYIGSALTTSVVDLIPDEAVTVSYGVRAYQNWDATWQQIEAHEWTWQEFEEQGYTWGKDWSGTTYGSFDAVPNLIGVPTFRTIPTLNAGNDVTISWSQVQYATRYSLQIKYDTSEYYQDLYDGEATSFDYKVPDDERRSVSFRIQAYIPHDYTWAQIDAKGYTWAQLDSFGWTWALKYTDFAYSGELSIIPNRPPVISGQNSDLGTKYEAFTVAFSVTDPEEFDAVRVVVTLDEEYAHPPNWYFLEKPGYTWAQFEALGLTWTAFESLDMRPYSIILEIPHVEFGREYEIKITNDMLEPFLDGSKHIIRIYAEDDRGLVDERVYTFTKVRDIRPTLTYYVMRDGRPVAMLQNIQSWKDYMEVGTHEYFILAVDENRVAVKSNTITATIQVQYTTIAFAGDPENYVTLMLRQNQSPQVSYSERTDLQEVRYLDREYPTFRKSGMKDKSISITYSSTEKEQFRAVGAMLSAGEPLIVRNHFDQRVIGVSVNGFNADMIRADAHSMFPYVTNISQTITQISYDEVVPYN